MEIYWCTAGCSACFVSECRERGGNTGRNIYPYLGPEAKRFGVDSSQRTYFMLEGKAQFLYFPFLPSSSPRSPGGRLP